MRRRINSSEGKKKSGVIQEYWQSYSDMMAALLLMFILIMAALLIQTMSAYLKQRELSVKIEEQQQQLKEILGIKPELIADIKKELADMNVKVDDNGDIMFESDILFDTNQSVLKDKGIEFLNDFIPRYLKILYDDKYFPYIAEIIVEGHTDTHGTFMHNLSLSQRRAESVAEVFIGDSNPFAQNEWLDKLRKKVTVTGKSFSEPIYSDDSCTIVDNDKSRRVEIKFRLKDEETVKIMEKLLLE